MSKISTFAVAALVAASVSGCGAAAAAVNPSYRYEVWGTGSGTATVTYTTDANGSTSNEAAVLLPWTAEVDMSGALVESYMITAIAGDGVEEIHCRITHGADVVVENRAEGQAALAVCAP